MSGELKTDAIHNVITKTGHSEAAQGIDSRADYIKNMAIEKLKASTTSILSPTARAAMKLESKLRSRLRPTSEASSSNDAIQEAQTVQAANPVTRETTKNNLPSTTTAQVCKCMHCSLQSSAQLCCRPRNPKK
jgi:hypothetical protein